MADSLSFEKELEKLRSVINSLAYRFPEPHRDDLVQEGLLGLYFAVKSYDPSRNVPFEAYAVLCVKRKMYTYCNKFIKSDFNFAEELEDVESDFALEDDVVEKALKEALFTELKQNLSEKEKGVWELYLQDLSYADIAQRLGIAEKSVDNAMSRIKAKLKKVFESQK